ncbi:MAG: hypothetical protein LKF71_02610 [Oscillospiraceae bacterium]|jgi:hypothetical protein|nr:hypothetical protein [Oscillospiraceae bacterium]
MPFNEEIQNSIITYCSRDLPNDSWYADAFDFVKNPELKARLICEFKNTRFIYKIFEGLAVSDELLLAEVRMQIIMYASIYEAILHYVLFDEYYKENSIVKKLLIQKVNKPFSIPKKQLSDISSLLVHNHKTIIPYFQTSQKREIEKVRFDEKCKAAFEIGLLTEIVKQKEKSADILPDIKVIDKMPTFCSELIRIYEVRNAIHLQAELKKEIEYHLQLSKIAYRRMQPFLEQIKHKLKYDGLY